MKTIAHCFHDDISAVQWQNHQGMIHTYCFDAKPFCLEDNNISKPVKSKKVMNFFERIR